MNDLLTLPADIWQHAKDDLRLVVSKEIFSEWFDNLKLVEGDTQKLVLSVNGEFAAIWIRDNFLDLLTKHISLAAGGNMKVEIVAELEPETKQESDSPISEMAHHPSALPQKKRENTSQENIYFQPIKSTNTFDTFVVGDNNRFAHSVALAAAQNIGVAFNPLLIYGATGLGKTHLMHAIAHFVMKNSPEKKVAFVSSEAFKNQYLGSIRDNKVLEFRRRYRNIDVLLIDDVQFFSGQPGTQKEFFHIFNDLSSSGKQIVLSCDKSINEVPDIEQRLVSRFSCGVSVDIQAPDYETRLAILHKKLATIPYDAKISPEVLEFLARRFTKNVRRLEGAFTTLATYSSLLKLGEPISLEKAQELLAEALMHEDDNQALDIPKIQKCIADYYKIEVEELVGRRRTASIALARQMAMYVARKRTKHSLQEIGKQFGNRDHGTVMHAIVVVENAIKQDPSTKRLVDYFLNSLTF